MDGITETTPVRDGHGRWAPGQSGNPAGKKPGTRNRVSRLRALLAEGDEHVVARALMERVRAGDPVTARFVAERLFAKPRDPDIDVGVAPDATPAEMIDRVVRAMMAGQLSIDEATRMLRQIDRLPVAARCADRPAAASVARDATPAEAAPPAFDLHLAGDAARSEPAAPPRPPNRHQRRRLAALERAARAPTLVDAAA